MNKGELQYVELSAKKTNLSEVFSLIYDLRDIFHGDLFSIGQLKRWLLRDVSGIWILFSLSKYRIKHRHVIGIGVYV